MKNLSLIFLLNFLTLASFAKDGYRVQVQFTDVKDSLVYLMHFKGRSADTKKDDSARLDSKGMVTFSSTKKITGGIYFILFSGRMPNLEFILNNGDELAVTTTKINPYANIQVKGSPENEQYYKYQKFLINYGKDYRALEERLKKSTNKKDSDDVIKQLNEKGKEIQAFRVNIIEEKPTLFISKLFKSIKDVDVPKEYPKLPNGEKDSLFPQRFLKAHFWDNFDFSDARFIYTPVYDGKMDTYLGRMVYPSPDSVNPEIDMLLKRCEPYPDMYRYTLDNLTNWTEKTNIMGLDECYVHVVENYLMKGKAPWLDKKTLDENFKKAQAKVPNMIGAKALDMTMVDTNNSHPTSLFSIKAKYTILIFWSTECSHCKEELPKFDSLYHAYLKGKDAKFYAVEIDNDVTKWKKFIRENHLNEGWIHVHDPKHTINFRSFYDVYSTPTLYLLDTNKKIIGKRLDYKSLPTFIEKLEQQQKQGNIQKK